MPNPIVGYSKLKNDIQLLFWSGASFEENLRNVGKNKAAGARYTDGRQINIDDLTRWLKKSKEMQWDYKNLVKRQGVLERPFESIDYMDINLERTHVVGLPANNMWFHLFYQT